MGHVRMLDFLLKGWETIERFYIPEKHYMICLLKGSLCLLCGK